MQTPRKNLAAVSPANSAEIYALGGRNDWKAGVLATMIEYDTGAKAWRSLASMNYARAGLAAVAAGANIYAVGGRDASGNPLSAFESYNVATNSWINLPSMPTARGSLAAVDVFGTIYALGGKSGTKYMSSVEAYNIGGGTWSVKADMPAGRAFMGAAVIGDTIYVMGGQKRDGVTGEVLLYNTTTDTWQILPVGLQYPRMRLTAIASTVYTGSKVFSFGGNTTGSDEYDVSARVESYSYNGLAIERLQYQNMPVPSQYLGVGAVLKNGSDMVYYAAGGSSNNDFLAANQEFQPDIGTPIWTDPTSPLAPLPMPGARTEHAVVGRGANLYAIGGISRYLDAAEVYNSSTDTWKTCPGLPTPRSGLAAGRTITGGKIYAVGGVNKNGDLDVNEEYNPATRIWQSRAAMPSKRKYPAAAFADGRLLVIGGMVSGTPLGTVEAYNPAADTWATLPQMPTARFMATAVNINGSIYVSGGATVRRTGAYPPYDPTGGDVAIVYVDAVEVYDPASNSWTSVPEMPTARMGLGSAGLVNGQLYAVGGLADGEPTALNERYNPVLRQWEQRAQMGVRRAGLAVAAPSVSGSLFAIGGEIAQNVSLLQDGTFNSSGTALASAEVYIPDPAQFGLTLAIVPQEVQPGESFAVQGLVKNASDSLINAVSAQTGPYSGGSLVSLLGSPAGTLSLSPGESTVFTASYLASAAGLVYFSFTVSGTDSASGLPVAASAYSGTPLAVGYRAALDAAISIQPLPMSPGSGLSVTLTISNTGGGTAYDGSASMAVPVGAGLVTLVSGPIPSGTMTIGPGAFVSITWTYSVVGAGYAVFAATGSWTDRVFGPVSVQTTRSTQPSSPSGLAGAPGTAQVVLGWNPNPAQEQVLYYIVNRRVPGGTLALTGTATGTKFVDSGLVNGQAYYYSVAAVNADGPGLPCAEIRLVPLMFPGRSGEIWISSTGPNPLSSNPLRGERTQILINVPGCGPLGAALCEETLKATVYTLLGEEVAVIYHGPALPGEMLLEWDGRNDRGRTVASGGYMLGVDLPDGRRVLKKMAIVK